MSIENFDNALRSKLAHDVGNSQAVLFGWYWNQILKTRKFNEMIKTAKLEIEHDSSKIWIINDIIAFEKFLKDEEIEAQVYRGFPRPGVGKRVEMELKGWVTK